VLIVVVVVVHSKVKYSFQRHTSFDDAHFMCLMFFTANRLCELAPIRAGACGLLVGAVLVCGAEAHSCLEARSLWGNDGLQTI
jgi:hypothetical protein